MWVRSRSGLARRYWSNGVSLQLAVIIIAGAAANYAFATVGPLQETKRIALGLTDNQIGVPAMNASALVAEFVVPNLRGRTLMILGIAQVAGMSGAFALGGKLVALYGADSNGWRWTMLWLAVPVVVALALTFWVREPQRLHGGRRKLAWRAAFAGLWRYWALAITAGRRDPTNLEATASSRRSGTRGGTTP
jgi:MFS family permease